MIINNGYNTKFKSKPKKTPQSIIEWFNTRIFWDLRMYGQIRQKDESGVPERIYNMFTKAISKEGLNSANKTKIFIERRPEIGQVRRMCLKS
ncbi:hypothetical protein OXX69_002354 [Metschnikowia pulcherrima]